MYVPVNVHLFVKGKHYSSIVQYTGSRDHPQLGDSDKCTSSKWANVAVLSWSIWHQIENAKLIPNRYLEYLIYLNCFPIWNKQNNPSTVKICLYPSWTQLSESAVTHTECSAECLPASAIHSHSQTTIWPKNGRFSPALKDYQFLIPKRIHKCRKEEFSCWMHSQTSLYSNFFTGFFTVIPKNCIIHRWGQLFVGGRMELGRIELTKVMLKILVFNRLIILLFLTWWYLLYRLIASF